jgi:hypothetical protein
MSISLEAGKPDGNPFVSRGTASENTMVVTSTLRSAATTGIAQISNVRPVRLAGCSREEESMVRRADKKSGFWT